MAAMVALACMATSALAHDFGGPSGPGPPPPPDGCPGCCGGGGGGGNPCNNGGPPCGSSGNPVNFWDGSERHTTTDVRLNGYIPITLDRIYDSRVDYDSPMGYGWAHSYDLRVFRYPDGTIMLRRSCGGRGLFVPSGGGFISPPGEFNNTLIDNGDGTVTLVERSGTENKFDLRGRLEFIKDVHGSKLEFLYDPAGRRPLTGTSKFSLTPAGSGTVALDYRLTKIRERDALGALTGREVNLTYDATTGRLDAVSDFAGRSWDYSHDANGNLTSVVGPLGSSSTYTYADPNDMHNLSTVSEPTMAFSLLYDGQDRVTRQTTGRGTVWNITYTTPLLRTTVSKTVVDPNGATLRTGTTIYDFNSFGNPTKTTDALGNETTFVRDAQGNTTTKQIRQNVPGTGLVLIQSVAMTYDAAGNIITEAITQHSTGEVLTKQYTYDHNLVLTERVFSSADPGTVHGYDKVFAHNTAGYPTVMLQEKRILANGGTPTPTFFTTTYQYNAHGQLTRTTYPNGDFETSAYTNGFLTNRNGEVLTADTRGNFLTRLDRGSNLWTFTYDDLDRVLTSEDPTGNMNVMTYTGANVTQMEMGKTSGAAGRIHLMTYDVLGGLTLLQKQTGSGPITIATRTLDSEGREIRVRDGANRGRTMVYDTLDRAVSVADGVGTHTYEYDALGNQTRMTDPMGRITRFTNRLFERPGKPLTVINGLNKTYTAVMDAMGNLKTLTDPLSNTLTEVHDAMGRILSFTTDGGATTSFTYNTRGQLGSRTDALLGVTTYSYNTRGALTGIDYPGVDQVTLTLDAGDRITRAVDADSDLSYAYDGWGRLTQEVNNATGRSVTFTYNSRGRRASVATSDGVTTTYEYSDIDFIQTVKRNGATEVTYVRDNAGSVQQATYSNGQVVTYTRDAAGRLNVQETRDGTATLINQTTYTRDLSGLILVKHEIVRHSNGTNSDLFFHYTYDNGLRLTREEIRDSTDVTIMSARNFTYDDVGNRLTMAFDAGPSTAYAYGADYRLASETTGASAITYTYDARGNLLTETFGPTTVTYGYDAESRLISLDSPTNAADYALSWDGRRLSKTLNGSTTGYLLDAMNIIGEYPAAAPAISYLTGLELNEYIAKIEGATKSSYNQVEDTRSILQLSSVSGAVQNSYVYRAFGEIIDQRVTTPNVNTYTGGRTDAESAHLYFRERLYSPRTGRFLSLDPFRPDASRAVRMGASQRVALSTSGVQASPLFDQRRDVNVNGMDVTGYLYVGNNPVNGTDPTGEVILWNPVSGSLTSGCGLSGCLGSGCGISGCGGSGCIGSGCGGSGCGGSLCGASGCAGSACAGSVCGGSACTGSACGASGCLGSACGISGCLGSGCGVSYCLGSGCGGSACGGSACIVSVCGASGCIGSACFGSGCYGSTCNPGSSCTQSGCTSSGCGSSGGCAQSGCAGSACNANSGCNSPCC